MISDPNNNYSTCKKNLANADTILNYLYSTKLKLNFS